MRLKDTIDKIPGGLMLAPLLLGALCRTLAPDAGNTVDLGNLLSPLAGLAASSIAGAAVANPFAIAAVAPQFSGTATPLIAICVIVTSIVVPILTGLWYKRFGNGMAQRNDLESDPVSSGERRTDPALVG